MKKYLIFLYFFLIIPINSYSKCNYNKKININRLYRKAINSKMKKGFEKLSFQERFLNVLEYNNNILRKNDIKTDKKALILNKNILYKALWSENLFFKNLFFDNINLSSYNKVFLGKDKKQILSFWRKIKKKRIYKMNKIYKHKKLFYLILNNYFKYELLVKYIVNSICNCNITFNNIRKSVFFYNTKKCNDKEDESIIVYFAEKKFTRIEDGFKVKHNFKIRISKYGELVDLNWTQLGERIEKPKIKPIKKKK